VLCERARALAEEAGGRIDCDVGELSDPDLVAIDVFARLQLSAKRRGGGIRLLHASEELRGLLALTGLSEVVPCALGLEARGEPEEREEVLGVEEEADPGDLTT
jgi:hypothetical protein